AHAQNVIHRDIKPDNILLTRSGKVKLADLGMVKIEDEEMSLTQTGHAVGTPWYMPLEQARNAKDIDGRSDIYALGCSLYAFVTRFPAVQGPPHRGRQPGQGSRPLPAGTPDKQRRSRTPRPHHCQGHRQVAQESLPELRRSNQGSREPRHRVHVAVV